MASDEAVRRHTGTDTARFDRRGRRMFPSFLSSDRKDGGGIDIWEKCVQVYQSAGVMTPFPFFLPARFFCGVHLIPVFARDSEQNRREQKRGDEIRYHHQGIHRVGDQPEGTEIDERQRADGDRQPPEKVKRFDGAYAEQIRGVFFAVETPADD